MTNVATRKPLISQSEPASMPIASAIAAVPSVGPDVVQAFLASIDSFAEVLGEGVTLPQPDAMRRMLKARTSAPTLVPMLADLSVRYDIVSHAFPTAAILARQELVKTLLPIIERISAVQKLVNDVSFIAQSEAWEGAMVTYGLLKSEGRGNAVLRKALLPVREEMRIKYTTAEGTKTVKRARAAKDAGARTPARGAGVAPEASLGETTAKT